MEVQEILHGKPRRLRMAVTQAGPGRWIRYRVFPGLGGEFGVNPVNGGSQFTAVIDMGVRAPVIGPVAGWLVRRTLGNRIDAIGHHAEGGAPPDGVAGTSGQPVTGRLRAHGLIPAGVVRVE
jgi:hypothetical protein